MTINVEQNNKNRITHNVNVTGVYMEGDVTGGNIAGNIIIHTGATKLVTGSVVNTSINLGDNSAVTNTATIQRVAAKGTKQKELFEVSSEDVNELKTSFSSTQSFTKKTFLTFMALLYNSYSEAYPNHWSSESLIVKQQLIFQEWLDFGLFMVKELLWITSGENKTLNVVLVELLKEIFIAPTLLFIWGNIDAEDWVDKVQTNFETPKVQNKLVDFGVPRALLRGLPTLTLAVNSFLNMSNDYVNLLISSVFNEKGK